MKMSEWARNEVEMFKKGVDEYMSKCADVALKAYELMSEYGHSGYSWSRTRDILMRLMDDAPLTPITDKDFENVKDNVFANDTDVIYQCPRMSSLFKHVNTTSGEISYHDVNRVVKVDQKGNCWHNGTCSELVDERHPITLPYFGGDVYKVYCRDYTLTENGEEVEIPGEYNRMYVEKIVCPDGTVEYINKTFEG